MSKDLGTKQIPEIRHTTRMIVDCVDGRVVAVASTAEIFNKDTKDSVSRYPESIQRTNGDLAADSELLAAANALIAIADRLHDEGNLQAAAADIQDLQSIK